MCIAVVLLLLFFLYGLAPNYLVCFVFFRQPPFCCVTSLGSLRQTFMAIVTGHVPLVVSDGNRVHAI